MKKLLPSRIGKRIADALIAHAVHHPYFHLPGYMERYWLVKPRRWLPFCVRIHHILRSDNDRHLHDHPWPWISLILRGSYTEVTPKLETPWIHVGRLCDTGSIRMRGATSRHRLILPRKSTTWTLFIMGPRCQEWGFYTETGKVPWHEYLSPQDVELQLERHQFFGIRE